MIHSIRFWLSIVLVALATGYLGLSLISILAIVIQRRQIPTMTVDFPDLWLDFSDGFLGGSLYQISIVNDAIAIVCLSIGLLLYFSARR